MHPKNGTIERMHQFHTASPLTATTIWITSLRGMVALYLYNLRTCAVTKIVTYSESVTINHEKRQINLITSFEYTP